MRFIIAGLLITLGCISGLITNTSYATCIDDCESQNDLYAPLSYPPCNYYMGLTYIQSWLKPRSDWNKLFVTSHPGVSFFFGRRLNQFFSLEIGYEWNTNRPRRYPLLNGTTLLGIPNLSGRDVVVVSKARLKTGYLDLQTHLPILMDDCFGSIKPEFIVMAGISNTRPKMHVHIVSPNPNIVVTPFLTPSLRRLTFLQGRTRTLYRLGIGVQGFVFNNLALRLMWRFQNTSALRPRLVDTPEFRKMFKDSQSVSLGIFTTFPAF